MMKSVTRGELGFLTVRNPARTVSIHDTGVSEGCRLWLCSSLAGDLGQVAPPLQASDEMKQRMPSPQHRVRAGPAPRNC